MKGRDALGNKYSKYFQDISDEEGEEYAMGCFSARRYVQTDRKM